MAQAPTKASVIMKSKVILTLYTPKKLAASISARIQITINATRAYQIVSDFPLATPIHNNEQITALGNINGAGSQVTLNVTNGDIFIKNLEP